MARIMTIQFFNVMLLIILTAATLATCIYAIRTSGSISIRGTDSFVPVAILALTALFLLPLSPTTTFVEMARNTVFLTFLLATRQIKLGFAEKGFVTRFRTFSWGDVSSVSATPQGLNRLRITVYSGYGQASLTFRRFDFERIANFLHNRSVSMQVDASLKIKDGKTRE